MRLWQALLCVREGGFDKDDEDVNCYRIRHRGDFYTVVLCNVTLAEPSRSMLKCCCRGKVAW